MRSSLHLFWPFYALEARLFAMSPAGTRILPGRRLLEVTVSMVRLDNLFSRRQRILKRKTYPARHIVAMEDCSLGEIIQSLDYDRFHIIYVLNSAMEITGSITEQQILKALQTHTSQEAIGNIIPWKTAEPPAQRPCQ